MRDKNRPYSNAIVVAMGGLSALCALAVLIIFIVFVSLKKPPFKELKKYVFIAMLISFVLNLVYTGLTFLKDIKVSAYGRKTWGFAVILFITTLLLNSIALERYENRVLPLICLSLQLGVAGLIILINTYFFFDEAAVPDSYYGYFRAPPAEVYSDYEENEPTKGFVKKEVNIPTNSVIKDHFKMDSNGTPSWKKVHFILAIENSIIISKRWKQLMGGIKAWLKSLSNSEDMIVSIFTFDCMGHNGKLYRRPSELIGDIGDFIFDRDSKISLDSAISTYVEVLKDNTGKSLRVPDWLHYGVLVTAEGSEYPSEAVEGFTKFKRRYSLNFFFNVISQTNMVGEINKIANELEGVHYTINAKANFGKAFVEAMKADPFKN